jgi:hypothetical protein
VAIRKREDLARRVRHLIAVDATNVMARLRGRQVEMVSLFSRMRDRSPLLGVIHSWFHSITFGDLVKVEPAEQRAINQFYELLGEVRWYLQYTEDMPLQVQKRVTLFMRQLETKYRRLIEVIGPPDAEGAPVVEATVVEHSASPIRAVVPIRSRRRH